MLKNAGCLEIYAVPQCSPMQYNVLVYAIKVLIDSYFQTVSGADADFSCAFQLIKYKKAFLRNTTQLLKLKGYLGKKTCQQLYHGM